MNAASPDGRAGGSKAKSVGEDVSEPAMTSPIGRIDEKPIYNEYVLIQMIWLITVDDLNLVGLLNIRTGRKWWRHSKDTRRERKQR